MQYLLLLTYRPEDNTQEGTPEFDAEMKRWGELNDEMREAGVWVGAAGLSPDATTTVRAPAGETVVTDGPYAETKEVLVLLLRDRRRGSRRGDRLGREDAGRQVRLGRDPPDGRARADVSALERAYRDERAAVLATITRRLDGDLALAEDVVQDAFVAAAVEWDRRGVPDRPGAWLTTTAWRKALDRLRHERVADAHAADLAQPVSYDADLDFERSSLEDDQLR